MRPVWSLILFGFETTMLKLHLNTLQNSVDQFIVHESNITFQNTPKSLYLRRAIQTREFSTSILSKLNVLETFSSNSCRNARCIKRHQRARTVDLTSKDTEYERPRIGFAW